jgi:outer membrane protein assembly factor BamE (lipoprotein component of BamABCDE complex)
MKKNKKTLRKLTSSGVIISLVLLGGCLARVETRGNLPDPELLSSLESKNATQNEVSQILGSPSTVAMFENETWFYISERTETLAFFKPEVMERQVVILVFDTDGTLKEVDIRDLTSGQMIDPVDRETPTLGIESGIFDQLFGNLGRFNTD